MCFREYDQFTSGYTNKYGAQPGPPRRWNWECRALAKHGFWLDLVDQMDVEWFLSSCGTHVDKGSPMTDHEALLMWLVAWSKWPSAIDSIGEPFALFPAPPSACDYASLCVEVCRAEDGKAHTYMHEQISGQGAARLMGLPMVMQHLQILSEAPRKRSAKRARHSGDGMVRLGVTCVLYEVRAQEDVWELVLKHTREHGPKVRAWPTSADELVSFMAGVVEWLANFPKFPNKAQVTCSNTFPGRFSCGLCGLSK